MKRVKKVRVNIKSGPHSQTTICGFGIHGISTQTDSVSARAASTQEGFDLHTPRVFACKKVHFRAQHTEELPSLMALPQRGAHRVLLQPNACLGTWGEKKTC